ncbi:MAG: hypothetical protein CMP11_01540 [Zetaproteobacteria bacterium]|nr:hypothetical protein [Pseudobdellovibrionaceae bacterium]
MEIQSKCPAHMIISTFEKKIKIKKQKLTKSWIKLQKRETFVEGQIPPFRVEFNNINQNGTFETNELNIHHGPFLHLPGVIGEINDSYRGLYYLYGSYVLSFRFIRPVELEFFKEEDGIRLCLKSYINPKFKKIWPLMNSFFWFFFKL